MEDPQTLREMFDWTLLRRLWAVDGAMILLYIVVGVFVAAGRLPEIPDIISIGQDWSIPESFNYLKWLSIFVLLVSAARRSGLVWPVLLAVGFALVLADDALMIHEHFAMWFVWPLLPENWRSMPAAEASMFGLLGLVLTVLLVAAWLQAERRDKRKIVGIYIIFIMIAFFAVGVDSLHDSFEMGLVVYSLIVVIEDGGELLMTSVMLAYVAQTIWRPLMARSKAG